MQKLTFVLLNCAALLVGCAQKQYINYTPPPSPMALYAQASNACVTQLSPVKEINQISDDCGAKGPPPHNFVATTKCVAPILHKQLPNAFKEYPILSNIEKIAVSAPISTTSVAYQSAQTEIINKYTQFMTEVRNKHPKAFIDCDNAALLQYVAPTTSSPASFYEFTSAREDIALKRENGQMSYEEAKVATDKASAILISKLEAANRQTQQLNLMQQQVDAANEQAAATRAAAYQQMLRNLQPPAPAYPTNTNCMAMGNMLNCHSF
jgi:hypothetical protein